MKVEVVIDYKDGSSKTLKGESVAKFVGLIFLLLDLIFVLPRKPMLVKRMAIRWMDEEPNKKPVVNSILSSKAGLTSKESDVLVLMVLGYTNKEIGEALNISPTTAKNHASSIISKFRVNSRGKAVAMSLSQGIVSL